MLLLTKGRPCGLLLKQAIMNHLNFMNVKGNALVWLFGLLFLSTSLWAQPANDDPCNAIDLTVGSVCTTSSFTSLNATPTNGITAPGCGNYQGGDVWFSVVMPSNGLHTVLELQGGAGFDGGMAVYSGIDCNNLVLETCDDNSGGGMNPTLRIDDGTHFENVGATYWVRVWENGNDHNGSFDICAYAEGALITGTPINCNGNYLAGDSCRNAILLSATELNGYCGNTQGYDDFPNAIDEFCANIENNSWLSFIAAETDVELDIIASNCDNNWGIQVQIFETSDCINFTPKSNCWNSGFESSGTMSITDLVIGEIYYIHIDGWGGDFCDYTINVNQGIASISVTAQDTTICSGQSTMLQAIAIGAGPFTYEWSPIFGLNDPTSPSPIATPAGNATYTVTITGPTETVSESINITVFPTSPGASSINGANQVCENTTGVVYTITDPDASIFSWTVDGGGTIVGSNVGNSVVIDWGSSGGNVCVDIANECGTAPSTCMAVSTLVQPNISAVDPAVVCAPTQVSLSSLQINNSASASGPISFHPDQASAENGWPIINPPVVDTTGTYWIRMQTGGDCYDVTSVFVEIEYPEVSLIHPQPVCTPTTINLSNVVVFENGWGPGTRTYFTDSLDAVAQAGALTDPVVTTGGTYWMRFETPNGCADVVPIEVVIEQTPNVSIPQQPVICPGEQLDLATVPYVDANNATITLVNYYNNQNFANFGISNLSLDNTTGTVISTATTYWVRTENSLGCFDVTPIIVGVGSSPQAQIDGNGPVCPGTEAAISFDLNGVGPFDVTYSDGTTNTILTGIDDAHVEMVTVNTNTTFTLVSVSDQTTCAGMVVGSSVTIDVTTPPTVEITGDVSACGGTTTPLNFALTGNGPFDVVYTNGTTDFTLNGIVDGHSEMITASTNETFVIQSVTDVDGCVGTFSGDAIITFYDVLEVINLSETCNLTNDGYTVSFEIVGGDASSYNITGSGGSLVGNVYTSVEIANNTAYNFTVSDNGPCPSVDLVGLRNCQCTTDPGTIQQTLLEACANGTVDGSTLANGDHTLQINDLLRYALHDNSSNNLGGIFDINETGVFTLMPGMTTGTTYFISPIVGPDNGNGDIDLGHLCFGVAPGAPVIFYDLPQAVINGGAAICSGDPVVLTFNFNAGTGPFDVVYTDGMNQIPLDNISDGHTVTVNPIANTTYSIVSVTDNTSAACAGFGSGIASVTINEIPSISNVTYNCNATNTEYQVSFEISGGDASTYAVTGGLGTLDPMTQIFTSDWLPNGTAYSFEVDDVNGCGPSLESGSHVCDCSTATVNMSTETILLCEDVVATATYTGTEVLDGDDVFGFVLHDLPGSTIGTVFATNTVPEFGFATPLVYGVTYYVSAVVGNDDGSGFPVLDSTLDPCLAIAPGQPVVFTRIPTASLTGDVTLCEGESTDLTFNFTGIGPFDVTYNDGVNNFMLNNILDGHQVTVTPETNSTYTLIDVVQVDAPNCVGTIDPMEDRVSIAVIEIPEVENVMVNCNTAGTDYMVTFDIVGGNPNNYFVNGDPGILTGNTFTSNWMISGTTFTFEVSDGTICTPITISDVGLCNCTPDIKPYISVNENISCPGDADGELMVRNLNGIAPYSFEWSNGGTSTVQSDLSAGMYVVTMTDGNGCISVDSLLFSDPDSIRAEIITEPVSCFGENDGTFTFTNVTGGTGDYDYELDVQSSYIGNEFYKLNAGTYGTTITDALGCTWEGEGTVEEPDQVLIDLGETVTLQYGDSIQLEANFNQAIDSFYWTPATLVPCGTCRKPFVRPFNSTTFSITAINEFGCEGTEEVKVNVLTNRPVYIPNTFSPNGDGNNDEFMIYSGVGVVKILTFEIYGRWGEALYERRNIDPYLEDFGWDGRSRGRKLSTGVYIYYAEIEFADGSTEMFRGDITLLR